MKQSMSEMVENGRLKIFTSILKANEFMEKDDEWGVIKYIERNNITILAKNDDQGPFPFKTF